MPPKPERKRPRSNGRQAAAKRRPSKPSRKPLCRLEGDRVIPDSRISPPTGEDIVRCLAKGHADGVTGLTLDFSMTQRAYPQGMVQVVAQVEYLRGLGMHFDLIPPEDRGMARVFEAANWAHIINPAMHDPSPYRGDAQMPVRRYGSGSEQKDLVNEALEVALHQMHLERAHLAGLEWALNEITDNVLNHAAAPNGGLVQVATFHEQGRVQFVVADTGIGVYESMSEGHPELRNDKEAIGEALKQGVTRSSDVGQGNGLAGALRIATQSGGSFAIASGTAELQLIPRGGSKGHQERAIRRAGLSEFHGTYVFVEIKADKPLDLESALDFGKGRGFSWDYLDAVRKDEPDFTLNVATEAVGFGSREAGRAVRTKISNLLEADPAARVLLDWTGVPMISSSFADELLGRLFVALGPVQFNARVVSVAMEPVVQGLVDRAILQRAAQALDR